MLCGGSGAAGAAALCLSSACVMLSSSFIVMQSYGTKCPAACVPHQLSIVADAINMSKPAGRPFISGVQLSTDDDITMFSML